MILRCLAKLPLRIYWLRFAIDRTTTTQSKWPTHESAPAIVRFSHMK